MKIIYLVWKDPSCGGINPDWLEITGQEFYALTKAPKNKGRRFIKLYSASGDGSDGDIVMESTKEDYIKWRREKNHSDWVRKGRRKTGYQMVSYHAMQTEDGCYGEELLRDENWDVEAECLKQLDVELLRTVIRSLSNAERQMIEYFYLSENPGTEREYSLLTGIPQKTINDRKNRLLTQLKNIFNKNPLKTGSDSAIE